MYYEPLKHALSPREGLIESFSILFKVHSAHCESDINGLFYAIGKINKGYMNLCIIIRWSFLINQLLETAISN